MVAEIKKIMKEKESQKPMIISSIVQSVTKDGKMTPENVKKAA